MNEIILDIAKTLASKLFDWLKEKASKDPKYFKIKDIISPSIQNKAINDL